jgi:hypothetical protein
VPPEFIFLIDNLVKEEYKVVYIKITEKCPVCGAKLDKNGTNTLFLNKNRVVRKQKYVCSDKECKKHTIVSLKQFIDKYCNYTKVLKDGGLNMGSIDYFSYGKKSELIEMMTGVQIPRQTVHYHEKTQATDYLDKKRKRNSTND